jgi:hypothetical protein
VTVTLTTSGNTNKRADVSAAASCSGSNHGPLSLTPTAGAITFYVCGKSTDSTTFTFSGIGVRPTASTPLASGNMYLDTGGVSITGVTAGSAGTSFGSLLEVAGPTTQLGVSIPASVTAGSSQTVTVTAKDAYGNTNTGYTGTVHLTSTDPAAVLPANYTFTAGDTGVHAFTGVVLKTAGNRSVTATDTVTASITGVGSTTVAAASAASLSLTGITNPFTAGASSSATVTAKDVYGNTATGYTGTVHFTSTDTAATLPANYAFTGADAGTHTFSGLVLRTAGNQGVTVTAGAMSASQSPITVQPGALDHLVLSPSSATIDAGTSRSFTAQGYDANNNSIGNVTSTTTFSVAPNGSCVASSCTATIAGAHTVTGNRSGATGTASLQVNPAAPQVSVTLTPSTVVADGASTSTVRVNVADQYGNARAGDTVALSTDGDAQLSAVHDNGDGTYTATFTSSTVAGTQTLTAVDGSANGSATLTQVAGAPSHVTLVLSAPTLEADGVSTSNATVTVADAHGNPRTGDAVTLVTNGDVTISAVTDHGFGTYTATMTASTTAGTETLTATDGAASTTAQLVELAPVSVTGVSPDVRGQGANGGAFGQSVTVTGTGFTPGSLADFGSGVTVKFTTFVDANHLVAHVVVAGDAAVGARTVSVTVSDGRSATSPGAFTVAPGPHVTGVSPNEIGPGAQRTVVVTGDNFSTNIKVTVPASGVAVTSVAVVDANHLSVGLSTAFAAPAGPRDLVVTNLADAGSTTSSGAFTVTPAPVVGDISPAELGGGAQATVTVTGSSFVEGARVSFAGTGVAVLSQSRVDDGHIVATLSIAGTPTPGARTVSVVNPDGGRGSCATCFAVNAAPTASGMAPSTLVRGTTTQVTITGTGFVPGATVSLGTGVTVSGVAVVDSTTITATVSVAPTTGTGSRTIVVTNPDLGKGVRSGVVQVV